MIKIRLGLIVVGLLIVSGCGSTKYCKSGATTQEFNKDKYECAHRARQMAQFGDVYNPFEDIAQQKECLEYRGWSKCSE
jgi:hypothetical protein